MLLKIVTAWERLGKHMSAATHKSTTRKTFLEVPFSVRSEQKLGDEDKSRVDSLRP
jgi:hypothetical protein